MEKNDFAEESKILPDTDLKIITLIVQQNNFSDLYPSVSKILDLSAKLFFPCI